MRRFNQSFYVVSLLLSFLLEWIYVNSLLQNHKKNALEQSKLNHTRLEFFRFRTSVIYLLDFIGANIADYHNPTEQSYKTVSDEYLTLSQFMHKYPLITDSCLGKKERFNRYDSLISTLNTLHKQSQNLICTQSKPDSSFKSSYIKYTKVSRSLLKSINHKMVGKRNKLILEQGKLMKRINFAVQFFGFLQLIITGLILISYRESFKTIKK